MTIISSSYSYTGDILPVVLKRMDVGQNLVRLERHRDEEISLGPSSFVVVDVRGLISES